jgi:hypothetical protein
MFVWNVVQSYDDTVDIVRAKNCFELSRPSSPSIEVNLPKDLLRPLLKGSQSVRSWSFDSDGLYLLYGYQYHPESEELRIVNDELLQLRYPDLWLELIRPHLDRYQGRTFQRNGYQARDQAASLKLEINSDTSIFDRAKCYVAIPEMNSGHSLRACVVRPVWDNHLQKEVLPVPGHKLNVYVGHDDLCYYLAAFFNAPLTSQIFSAFTSAIGLTPTSMRRLPIPEFDCANPYHMELVRISKELHLCYSHDMEVCCYEICNRLLGSRPTAR